MSYNTGIIECSSFNGEVFHHSAKGDVLFYPLNNDQSILIGTSNDSAGFKMKNNMVGIGMKENPLLHDFQVGSKTQFDNDLTMRDSKIIVQKPKGIGGVARGAIMLHPDYHGTFFGTIADSNQLSKVTADFPGDEALEKINQIQVHVLKEVGRQNSLGCLADEIFRIYPECVIGQTAKAGNPLYQNKMIDYSKIVPLLIKSVQELSRKIDLNSMK